ncbi:MAG TPA: cell division protein FtsL, partial [Actinomycetota bacterium]
RTRRPRPAGRRAPARHARKRLPFLLFSLVVVSAMIVLLVSAQAIVAQSAFRITELRERVDVIENEHAQLRLEAARLSSPERIMRAARDAGLVLPDRVEILAVSGKGASRIRSHLGTLASADLGGEG